MQRPGKNSTTAKVEGTELMHRLLMNVTKTHRTINYNLFGVTMQPSACQLSYQLKMQKWQIIYRSFCNCYVSAQCIFALIFATGYQQLDTDMH